MSRVHPLLVLMASLAAAAWSVAHAGACDDARTSEAVAGCLAQELRAADANINATYSALMARLDDSGRSALRAQQRAWLKQRDADCELSGQARDREQWYRELLADYGKTVCVTRYTRRQNESLAARLHGLDAPAAPPAAAPPAAAAMPPEDKSLYRLLSHSSRQQGLWYFEVTLNPPQVPTPTDVWYGCRREHYYAGGLVQLHGANMPAPPFHAGIALDLAAGKLYVRDSLLGWSNGAPGTSGGSNMKLAENYRCGVETTALLKPLLDNGALRINLGDDKFFFPIPDGYRPFSDGGQ
jgi:uncharacterized protein YecT (DUF1311 family)